MCTTFFSKMCYHREKTNPSITNYQWVTNLSTNFKHSLFDWCNAIFMLHHYSDVTWTPWRLKSPELDCLRNNWLRLISKETSKSRYWLFVRGIHRWPVDSLHKGPVNLKTFPCHVFMLHYKSVTWWLLMSWCLFGTKPSTAIMTM